MTEIIIQTKKEEKQIALIENGNLVEYYEEDKEYRRREGNIYIGIVKDVINGMQSAFVDIGTEKNSFIHLKDILPKIDETKQKQDENIEISQVVKCNQKLLVQVKKDSNEKKGARVSSHINLPGKYIALLPNTDIVTVSQKIEEKKEQERLIQLVKANLTEGNGAIIRTSAQGKEKEVIEDIKKVENKWNRIIQTSINPDLREPQLLYKSENIVEKMLMDLADNHIEKVTVNDKKIKKDLENFKNENQEYQDLDIVLKEEENLLNLYDLEKQIEKIKNRKIWLKCGGFITIDKTEALTAIDVNTGKYTGNQSLEQTVFKVNQEATIEIAKQLRLRDIGGIVIVDYIDMKEEENKKEVQRILELELKKDRSKTQVEGFTKLDLMELTRKHICSHKD
ncbi:MAG: Rne/Rng family ribonuclease [Clostridia bacterium]|nr:Rne/Rng family ribonuclease [Clostridia bacterium]